jgi:nucleoside-diphosphate-sugar epimerase
VHHLLEQTGARAIISAPRLQRTADEASSLFADDEKKPAQHVQSHYESFIRPINGHDTTRKSTCHPDHYVGELDRAVLILHSSGTTGLPKPIYHSHRFLLNYTVCHLFSGAEEAEGLNLSTLPLYHVCHHWSMFDILLTGSELQGAGLVAPSLSLGVGKTVCLPPTSVISTGASTLELLKLTKARALITVPSILEEISLLPDNQGIPQLQPLQFVAFGGGRLKPSVGEKLAAAGVRLLNHYGTTETGSLSPVFIPGPDYDWPYFRLRKDMNLTVEPVEPSDDGAQRYKLITRPFGWGTIFEIQDQLVSNPRNPMTDFNTAGRSDDLICLATGKKVFPGILESMLSETIDVKAAMAFGEGQFELGVLVEPSKPVQPEDVDDFKASIWPIIIEAGDRMDGHARIASKDAVIIIPPGKAMARSDKGSIMRKESYRIFELEIAEAYRILENSIWDGSTPPLNMDDLERDIKNLIGTELNWRIPDDQWSVTDDLFELGMDSLQALRLRRLLLRSLPIADNSTLLVERITREFVYLHPSVTELASALRQDQTPGGSVPGREDLIDQLVAQYSLPVQDVSSHIEPRLGAVVLLTGSTGSLGSYVLAHLANLEHISRVICLNRVRVDGCSSQDPYDRQLRAMKSRGIPMSEESWKKVIVFEANMAAPLLGLDDADYATLRNSVTHIVHNAWPMDFKRRLPSFKTQFQAMRNILTLCREAHKLRPALRPTLVFVSSIAVVGQYPAIHGDPIVPEKPMVDSRSTNPSGYGEAKLVCERILENAARLYHDEMSVKYIRCGQIAGSKETSFWNAEEYFPALLKSSQKIGVLPKIEGVYCVPFPRSS